jgi:hypothetical protein
LPSQQRYHQLREPPLSVVSRLPDPLPTAHPYQATPSQSHSQPEAAMFDSTYPTSPSDSSHSQPLHHQGAKVKHNGHVTSSSHRPTHHSRHRGDPQQGHSGSRKRVTREKHMLSNDSIFQTQPPPTTSVHRHGNMHVTAEPQELSPGGSSSSGCHRQQLSLDDTELYVNLREAASLMSGTEGSQVSGSDTPTFRKEVSSVLGRHTVDPRLFEPRLFL